MAIKQIQKRFKKNPHMAMWRKTSDGDSELRKEWLAESKLKNDLKSMASTLKLTPSNFVVATQVNIVNQDSNANDEDLELIAVNAVGETN